MNVLNRARYALGLIHKPPKIEFDEKFCLLTPKNPTTNITLENKIKIGHNAAIFRFNFPNDDLILGSKIGQYVNLNANIKNEANGQEEKVTRSFVPISGIDDMGIVDFLVRIYKPDEKTKFLGGAFTSYLDRMKVNDKIEMTGPYTTFLYNGMGSFDLPVGNELKSVSGIRYLGLIASGNGITAFFQMLETIARSRLDKTNVSLLYINREYKDLLLLEELVSFHEQHKLHLNLMVESPETYWPGLSGEVQPEILRNTLPPPGSTRLSLYLILLGPETLIMGCVSREKQGRCF